MTDWTLDVTRLDAIVPPEGLQAEPGYEDLDPITSHSIAAAEAAAASGEDDDVVD